MTVPVALEPLVGIDRALAAKKLGEARIARFDLIPPGIFVISQEIAPAARNGEIDQPPERLRGTLLTCRRMRRAEIEDRARPRLPRPGEKAVRIPFDQADRAVDDLDVVALEILRRRIEEIGEPRPRDVDLRDDLGRTAGRATPRVEVDVITVEIRRELVGVRPIDLAVGGQIKPGIALEGPCLVRMREPEELLPIVVGELFLIGGDRRIRVHRPITGKNPFIQKAVRGAVDRKLKVAVEEALADALLERRGKAVPA